ncbi:MAG TPA: hypothetical protein VF209_01635 [Patescibacteria group bacterium]
MTYVIACGDEGIQINEGTRLAIVGAGFKVDGFSQIVKTWKKLLGKDLRIAASEENDWIKEQLGLSTWEQTNASAQQHIQALADKEKLLYAGSLPFADPHELDHGIKGHMVRPHGIHIANKIKFTLGGGEQTYHLGQYLISAEWLSEVDEKLAQEVLDLQVNFYKKIAKNDDLIFEYELEGELGEEKANENLKILKKLGYAS